MTLVRILRDTPIAPDGISVQVWRAGSERSVSDDMLAILIDLGACEIVEVKAHAAAPEIKAERKTRRAKS